MADVTRILNAIEPGDPHAAEQHLPLVFEELRQLATRKLAQEKPGQTLQATALVHEAYLRLVGGAEQSWNSLGHSLCAAAEAMPRILIEQARRRDSVEHGGGRRRVDPPLGGGHGQGGGDLPTGLGSGRPGGVQPGRQNLGGDSKGEVTLGDTTTGRAKATLGGASD
jgi:hypothetical protein